ncbi:MAG: LPS export ABC transporter periplasmic protein LptC [Candidatus Ozemobacteraceae bacterium]
MKSIFSSIWFWLMVLLLFLAVIFRDSDLEKDAASKYVKGKMKLTDVHFSEMDQGSESARVFADEVEMDDMQSNMVASRVHAIFFDKYEATKTADLTASSATKNPYEIRFFGDSKLRTSENERLRSDELRYFISRKEIYTSCSVTIWKDDLVLTGKEMRFNTERREGTINRDILIRIWKTASGSVSTSVPGRAPASASASFSSSASPSVSAFATAPRRVSGSKSGLGKISSGGQVSASPSAQPFPVVPDSPLRRSASAANILSTEEPSPEDATETASSAFRSVPVRSLLPHPVLQEIPTASSLSCPPIAPTEWIGTSSGGVPR